jgi:hypothetical protein
LKPHRPLVRLPAGIALYAEDHRFSLAAVPGTATILMMPPLRLLRRIAFRLFNNQLGRAR